MSLEGVPTRILISSKDKSAGIKVLVQDQVRESFRLDWIESFEFGQEFEEVCIDWSTNIAPLWTLIINNLSFDSSFDLPLAFHWILDQATLISTTCFRILSADTFRPWTDYQTSQHLDIMSWQLSLKLLNICFPSTSSIG